MYKTECTFISHLFGIGINISNIRNNKEIESVKHGADEETVSDENTAIEVSPRMETGGNKIFSRLPKM